MSLANNTNIVSSLRSETSFKNFESTSAPLKKNTNRMKPKSGRSTIMENPIEINFKNALIETKNLYDFSDVVRNINYETATEKKSSMKKSNLNKDASNNQGLETTDNTLNMNRKQIKLQFGEDFLDYLDTIIEDHLGQQLPLNEEWKNYLNRYELQPRDYSLKRFSKGLQIGSQVLNIDYIGYKNRQDNNKKYFKIGKNTNMFNESVTNVTDLF
jgi:hypothetical protein